MLSGLFSFLGGTAFRWVFGEVFGFLKARQEHKQEIELRRLDMEVATANSQLRKEELQAAASAGVQIIEAQREATHENMADRMLLSAVEGVEKLTGIVWVDAWNKAIRPGMATIGFLLLVLEAFFPATVIIKAATAELIFAVLGLFCGGRISNTGR